MRGRLDARRTLKSLVADLRIKKILLQNVRIYVSADNLITWNLDKKFKSYDVELGGVDGLLDGGGTVPLARTFTAGINLTF